MSQENLELASEAVDAVARQDVERLIELTDPEVEWHSVFAQLGEGGVYRGHEGIRRYVRDLSDAWENMRTNVDDVLSVGAVVVLVGRSTTAAEAAGSRPSRHSESWPRSVKEGLSTCGHSKNPNRLFWPPACPGKTLAPTTPEFVTLASN
jgi:ketosteroid isomerase-like protein